MGNYTEMEMEQRIPLTRVQADPGTGLSAAQVKERLACHADNYKVESSTMSVSDIVKSNVFTYFNLVFAIIAVLLSIVGAWRDMLFLPIIVANTCIGIIQEVHSKKVLDKLSILNAPQSVVIRDGKKAKIPADKLVLDDVVEFTAGSQIPADAKVIDGELQVNESLITGESDEITKRAGDQLLSGSFVVSGKAYARLEKVGKDSYISKLTLQATKSKKGEQSEMIRSLDYLIMVMGIIIIPIGIALFVQSFIYNEGTLHDSITGMVAAIIGMIPEGLYLLSSVAMAVSSVRLAQKKVLIHDMKCIETLARVNVLCVDKTGTITEPGMHVYEVELLDGVDEDATTKILADVVRAQNRDNATMEALQAHFTENGGMHAKEVFSFSSETKFSGAIMEDGKSYVIGAPEFVLRSQFEEYQEQIAEYSSKGYRVLVFGEYEGTLTKKPLTEPVVPMGFVMLANPIRKEAPETFAYFAEQGVEVKVISGDNPMTVSEVAKEAGIANADRYVDAATLHSDAEIADAVANYTVFGRVTPDQKRKFVHALKDQGKTVAMTGDGVNDVLALKDADCSVAMASGSDAAVQASQVVLLESNFACMPSVVMEGRRVVNNIQRSASLFLVKNIFSFLLSLFSVVLMITYPMEPSQISLISMFTIGVPGFFLAFQPNKERIQGHFLTNVFLKALPAGLTDVLMVGALVVFGKTFGVNTTDISTAATMLLLIVGFIILFNICKPVNIFRGVVWGGCLTGCILCIIFLPKLFAITGMSTKCIMLFVVFSIATEAVLRYLTLLVKGLQKGYRKIRHREE